MNIDILINQHINWKSLVEGLFNENDCEVLDANVISKDNECDFGKWIYICFEEKHDLSETVLMKEIKTIHKDFHLITSSIINDFQSGSIDKAKSQLTTFYKTSEELINLMERLKGEISNYL